MNIWLKEIYIDDGIEYLELLNELSMHPDESAKPISESLTEEEFKKFKIEAQSDNSNSRNQKYEFWIMDDELPVGYTNLKRFVLFSNEVVAHVGLALKEEYQNKGVGRVVTELLEEFAYGTLEVEEMIYFTKNDNIQCQKLLDKIGAKYYWEKDGYLYYKVNLNKKFNREGRKM